MLADSVDAGLVYILMLSHEEAVQGMIAGAAW